MVGVASRSPVRTHDRIGRVYPNLTQVRPTVILKVALAAVASWGLTGSPVAWLAERPQARSVVGCCSEPVTVHQPAPAPASQPGEASGSARDWEPGLSGSAGPTGASWSRKAAFSWASRSISAWRARTLLV